MGLVVTALVVVATTFGLIRVTHGPLSVQIVLLGGATAACALVPGILAYESTSVISVWSDPLTRGLASGFAGYGVMPGLTRTFNIPILNKISKHLDARIKEHAGYNKLWLAAKDAKRLSSVYTVRCLIEIYQYTLVNLNDVAPTEAVKRAAELRSLMDDPDVAVVKQTGAILRRIRNWGEIDWPEERTVDGFIISLRVHGRARFFRNRLRRVLFMPPVLFDDAQEIVQ